TFLCELSGPSEVTWRKAGRVMKASDRVHMWQEANTARLTILGVTLEDRGEYCCDVGSDSSTAKLNIQGLSPLHFNGDQNRHCTWLGSSNISATLYCRLSKPRVDVEWRKDSQPIQPGDKFEVHQKDFTASLTVHKLELEDAGSYSCLAGDQQSTASLIVWEKPVVFTKGLQDLTEEELGDAVFVCEVSKEGAPVTWLKNGGVLYPGAKCEMSQDGRAARLVLHHLGLHDAGHYSCDTGHDVTTATLNVTDRPVHITQPLQDVEVHESGEATFLCELSGPSEVTWRKAGRVMEASDRVHMWQEANTARLTILGVTLEDKGEYSCDVESDSSTAKLTVQEMPVRVLEHLQNAEALEDSSATLSCRLSKPRVDVEWRKDSQPIKADDKFEVHQKDFTASLTVHKLELEDAGSYSCLAGDQQSTALLIVWEKPVVFTKGLQDLTEEELGDAVFVCEVSKERAPVAWLKNGGVLYPGAKCEMSQDGRAARLVLHHLGLHDAGHYSCDTGHDVTTATLNVTDRPVHITQPLQNSEAYESGEVTFLCGLSGPSKVTWRMAGRVMEASDRVHMWQDVNTARLTILGVTLEDRGEYSCDIGSDSSTAKLNVQELPIQILEHLQNAEAVEDSSATLSCHFSKPKVDVEWRKDSQPIQPDDKFEVHQKDFTASLTVHKLELEDAGSYSCLAGDQQSTASLIVWEKPVVFTKGLQDLTEEELGDAVFVCEVSKEGAPVTWLKNGGVLYPGAKCEMSQDGRAARLVLHHLGLHDAGQYSCDTGHDITTATLNVTGDLIDDFVKKPSNVFLGTLNVPLHTTLSFILKWSLADTPLQNNELNEISVINGKTHVLTINHLTVEESGTVSFSARNATSSAQLTVKHRPVHITQPLQDYEAHESGEATFLCELSGPSEVTWRKAGQVMEASDRVHMWQEANTARLTILGVTLEDKGDYCCDVGSDTSTAKLTVQELPVQILEHPQNVEAVEDSSATLSCRLSKPRVNVEWRKDSQPIQPDDKFEVHQKDFNASLTIHKLELEDAGSYSCLAGDQQSTASLIVWEKPVVFTKGLQDLTEEELGDAVLVCEVSKEGAPVTWLKNGGVLYTGPKCEMSQDGRAAKLVLHHLGLHDAGQYSCDTGHDVTTARLNVTDRPVHITQPLQDVEAHESGDVTFLCELSGPSEVTWRKAGQVMEAGDRVHMWQETNTARLIIVDVTMDDKGEYCCDIGSDSSTAKLNVQEMPVQILAHLQNAEAVEDSSATLSCCLSKPRVDVEWRKDSQPIQPDDKFEVYQKDFTASLTVHKLELEDAGSYSCLAGDQQSTASLIVWVNGKTHVLTINHLTFEESGTVSFSARNATSSAHLTVKQLPVQILEHLQNAEAVEDSSATLSCRFSKPRVDVEWRKDSQPIQPDDKFEVYQKDFTASLTVHKLELEDAGSYSCLAGDQQSTASLFVWEKPVVFTKGLQDLTEEELGDAAFVCEVSKEGAPVTWLKNGGVLYPGAKCEMSQDGRAARLVLHLLGLHDAGHYSCDTGHDVTTATLNVTDRPVHITQPLQDSEAHESGEVTFLCELSGPSEVTWRKAGRVMEASDRVHMWQETNTARLIIVGVTMDDKGEYCCDIGSESSTAKLNVQELPVQILAHLQNAEAVEDSSATLSCRFSKPRVDVEWRKDSQPIQPDDKFEVHQKDFTASLTVHKLELEDAGSYSCLAGDQQSTASLFVWEKPVVFTKGLQDLTEEELGDAAFVCEVSKEGAPVTWLKNGGVLYPGAKCEMIQDGRAARLVLHHLGLHDAGHYSCDTGHDVTTATLNVTVLIIIIAQFSYMIVLHAFQMKISEPNIWSLADTPLQNNELNEISVINGKTHVLTINHLTVEESGTVSFSARNVTSSAQLTVKHRPVHITQPLQDSEAHESGEVTFLCELSGPSEVTWRKAGRVMEASDRVHMWQETNTARLIIVGVTMDDKGEYCCDIGSESSTAKLNVQEMPVQIMAHLQNAEAVEDSSATLSCRFSKPRVDAEWRKDSQSIQPDDKFEVHQKDFTASLTVHQLELEDAGSYSCLAGDQQSTASLIVWEKPVVFTKGLQDLTEEELGDAVFVCAVSKEGAPVTWSLADTPLQNNELNEISVTNGKTHVLTINHLTVEESGTVSFSARNATSSAQLTVKHRPVHITQPLQDTEAHESGEVTFLCELSGPSEVTWRKAGRVMEASDRVHMWQEANTARLTIVGVTMDDKGEYCCDIGSDSSTAKLNVQEMPVQIMAHLQNAEAVEDSSATLSCCLSKPRVDVEWRKDSQPIQPDDKFEVHQKDFTASLTVHQLELEDAGSYSCLAGDQQSTASLIVWEKPVVFTKGLQDLTEEELGDAVFVCAVSKEGASVTWLKNGGVLYPGAKCEMSQDGRAARLVLHHLGLHDAGQYSCDTGHDVTTATLNVTGRPVHITQPLQDTEAHESGEATFLCELSGPSEVTWRKAGRVMEASDRVHMWQEANTARLTILGVTLEDRGEYSCDIGSDSSTATLNVQELPVHILEHLQNAEAVEDSSATLSCRLSKPRVDVEWRKDSQPIQPDDKFEVHQKDFTASLTIHQLELEDAGSYSCVAGDQQSTALLIVWEKPVVFTKGLQDQTEEELGDAVFVCEVSKEGAPVTWLKNGGVLYPGAKCEMSQDGTAARLVLHHLGLHDAGHYSCDTGHDVTTATLNVTERPVHITQPLQDVEAHESGEVTFLCGLSGPSEVTWRKAGRVMEASDRVHMWQETNTARLTILGATLEDRGEYCCDVGSDSSTAKLIVQELPVQILEHLQNAEAVEDSSATLSCRLSKPRVDVEWRKDSQPIKADDKFEVYQKDFTASLTVHKLELEDAGSYSCLAGDQQSTASLIVWEKPVVFTKGLQDLTEEELGDAVFVCEVSKEGAPVTWLKNGGVLYPGAKCEMSQDGRAARLVLHQLGLHDAGHYSCDTGHDVTAATLNVTGRPAHITQPLQDTEAYESGEATFLCELSGPSEVTWRKAGRVMEASDRVHMWHQDNTARLTILGVTKKDGVEYSCHVGSDSSSARLSVKELPLQIMEHLQNVEAVEDSSATLSCHLSKPRVDVEWRKDSQPIQPDDKFEVHQKDFTASLTVHKLELEDAGSYSCLVGDQQSTASLFVWEKPVVFTKGLQDLTEDEQGDAVFVCEVSKEGAPVTWLKNGGVLYPGAKCEISQDGRAARLVLHHLGLHDAGQYSCDTGHDVTTATLNVTELPVEVLGCIQDVEVTAGACAAFECTLSNRCADVEWWLADVRLQDNELNQMSVRDERTHVLTMVQLSLEDSGTLTFRARGASSSATLTVKRRPVLVVEPLLPVTVEETDEATLSCRLSEMAPVSWRREASTLEPGDRVRMAVDGEGTASLRIAPVAVDDAGVYTCETQDDSTSAPLTVTGE
uniref:Ig-like domain-containing protein n=1 Tax=Petromyzon marinus TaxID=7757 RepID=S4RHS9_PETMA